MITRRTFLRGAGATLALPLLDAMGPLAWAAEKRPLRLVYVYVPNGVHMEDWTPPGDGALAHGDGPGDHARASAAYLTCRHPRKAAGADIRVGISADQVAAKPVGRWTSCAYSSNISWRTESQPLAKEVDPRAVFDRLFRPDADLSPEEKSRRRRYRKSVLDLAGEDASRLRGRLGADGYTCRTRYCHIQLPRPWTRDGVRVVSL